MIGNIKVFNMWVPVIKDDARTAKMTGRVHFAELIKEGFLEEATSKYGLENCRMIAVIISPSSIKSTLFLLLPTSQTYSENLMMFGETEQFKLRELFVTMILTPLVMPI